MRSLFAACALLAVTGCSTMQDTASAMGSFKGRPLDDLIARVGYPDKQEAVVDKTAYYWGTNGVNDENAYVCQLKAVAGKDRIIVDTSIYGNIGGCESTIKRLR